MSIPALYFPIPADWMDSWAGIADLYLSACIVTFIVVLVAIWVIRATVALAGAGNAVGAETTANDQRVERTAARPRFPARWSLVLLAVCAAELLAHSGERNGFVASSRPTSGVETWTTADGYTMLLDGIPAQADGNLVLPMLRMFLGDAPPSPSELDRRAGHIYLVSLLERPLGSYWAFATVNLVAWWGAALAVWWLGCRYWPQSAVPWVASLLVATGLGFVFMGTAPQAQALAFSGFAVVLALCDALGAGRVQTKGSAETRKWAAIGWAAGAAGLIYLANVPALLFLWLRVSQARQRRAVWWGAAGAAVATLVASAITFGWQVYATDLLGLSFAGGNNELVGEAARNWLLVLRAGALGVIGQLHAGSPRGIFCAAFYYPWWVLAIVGLCASTPASRRWALAVLIAGGVPAIAFSTRFHLPRVAYFMYPAVYLLAARGIEVVALALAGWWRAGRPVAGTTIWEVGPTRPAAATMLLAQPLTLALIAGAVVLLAAIVNVDLLGLQQLNLWFHYSQGNGW